MEFFISLTNCNLSNTNERRTIVLPLLSLGAYGKHVSILWMVENRNFIFEATQAFTVSYLTCFVSYKRKTVKLIRILTYFFDCFLQVRVIDAALCNLIRHPLLLPFQTPFPLT